jgi:hypothetical protein
LRVLLRATAEDKFILVSGIRGKTINLSITIIKPLKKQPRSQSAPLNAQLTVLAERIALSNLVTWSLLSGLIIVIDKLIVLPLMPDTRMNLSSAVALRSTLNFFLTAAK